MKDITLVIPLATGKKIDDLIEIKKQKITTIPVYGENPSKNRNIGVRGAKTKYVAFINGHTLISKNWLKSTEHFLKEYPKIDIFGGPQLTSEHENLFGRASGYALSSKFGTANVSSRYNLDKLTFNADETMLTSANLICKKKVFEKVKFDETIYPGEDPKFISDAIKLNLKVAYTPKIFVYNKRRTDINSLIKQIFSYGLTRPKKESLIQTLKKPFFLVPSLFLIYLLFLPILCLISPLFIFPFFTYLLFNIIFSFYAALKNKEIRSFMILPIIFLLIHLSYGSGFIVGVIKYRRSKVI